MFPARRRDSPSGIYRPQWYDRNAVHVLCQIELYDAAPHALTVRWSYTVPSGKRAFVEVLHSKVMRATAASTVGLAAAEITLQKSGGSDLVFLLCHIRTNNVGDKDAIITGQAIILFAGDTLRAKTIDQSTGGGCDHLITAKATEFDA